MAMSMSNDPLAIRLVRAGEAGVGRGESAGDETCHMQGRARRGESASDETCPCGGGRAWGEPPSGMLREGVCWR